MCLPSLLWQGTRAKFCVTSKSQQEVIMQVHSSVLGAIPFLDLVTQHADIEQELTDVFRRVMLSAVFVGGPMVEEFEKAFANFCDVSQSIAVSSGTDALRFAI